MSLSVFLTTFGVVFLAELGDKTQLTAMALATRFPWRRAFVGIAAAFALLNLLAVAVGQVLFEFVPLGWIKAVSAALFLFFGVTTLLNGEESEEEEGKGRKQRGPVLTAFILILFAELGDKTQLVTAALSAQHARPLAVFAGSTLALWLVSLLGLLAGTQIGRFVSPKQVRWTAGGLFLLFGAVLAYQSFVALRP